MRGSMIHLTIWLAQIDSLGASGTFLQAWEGSKTWVGRFAAEAFDLPGVSPHRDPACVAQNSDYTACAVKQPLVNLEENVAKVVGRRLKSPDPLSVRMSRKQDAVAWRRAFGGVKVPRGVYRFHTHQEADAWLWQMICRPSRS